MIFGRHNFFRMAVIVKGMDGFLGMALGLVILLISNEQVINFFNFATSYELNEDPTDWLANVLIQFAQQLSANTRIFLAFYIGVYGFIKVVLAYGLWKRII